MMFCKMAVKKKKVDGTNSNKKKGRSPCFFLTRGFHNYVLGLLSVEQGLDYILGHFSQEECIWPRTISTKTTDKRQVLVNSKQEALARFAQANWLDCRISAYPCYTEYKGINRQPPDFIFIDLDRSTFKSERDHNRALSKTLNNIEQKLGSNTTIIKPSPTVLWSGNGYHVYLPVSAFVFEQEDIFSKYQSLKPSRRFMQFAESFLSDNKADRAHNITVSFKNCMLRVPGSINSKNDQTVKLLNMWNGCRPRVNPLLEDFYVYLSSLRIEELTKITHRRNGSSCYQSISRYMRLSRYGR